MSKCFGTGKLLVELLNFIIGNRSLVVATGVQNSVAFSILSQTIETRLMSQSLRTVAVNNQKHTCSDSIFSLLCILKTLGVGSDHYSCNISAL